MKKTAVVFLILLTLMMPAASAAAEPVPNSGENAGEPAAVPANEPAAVPDVPVDESSYQEETPGGYVRVERLPGRGTVDDIYAYWEENGYPDDVSYAFQSGGEMIGDEIYNWWEIALVGSDPARQQEILELVSPQCLVEFKNALFSHAEKAAAYDAITELAVTDPNILSVVFTLNDDTVWVSVPEELAKDYAKYLIRDLGLGAVVSVTDANSLDVITQDNTIDGALSAGNTPDAAAPVGGGSIPGGAVPDSTAPALSLPVQLWGIAVVLAMVLAAAALRRRLVPAAVTEEGTVRARTLLTCRQTARLVAETVETPGPAVYAALMARIAESGENSK